MDYSGGRSIDDFVTMVEDQLHPKPKDVIEDNETPQEETST